MLSPDRGSAPRNLGNIKPTYVPSLLEIVFKSVKLRYCLKTVRIFSRSLAIEGRQVCNSKIVALVFLFKPARIVSKLTLARLRSDRFYFNPQYPPQRLVHQADVDSLPIAQDLF